MRVPAAAVATARVATTRSSLATRLIAGVCGGGIVATLTANILSAVTGDLKSDDSNSASTIVAAVVFLGIWASAIVFSVRAYRAARVWRLALIVSACLSFALPIAAMIMAGKATIQTDPVADPVNALATAGAGGIATVVFTIFGLLMGTIFLIVGLLVGRERQGK